MTQQGCCHIISLFVHGLLRIGGRFLIVGVIVLLCQHICILIPGSPCIHSGSSQDLTVFHSFSAQDVIQGTGSLLCVAVIPQVGKELRRFGCFPFAGCNIRQGVVACLDLLGCIAIVAQGFKHAAGSGIILFFISGKSQMILGFLQLVAAFLIIA